ncbi:MAG: hypothetical protein OXC30_06855 [Alphaproteobacteria bacterium]|nr:hypothetical protein [Alphaproteobacteria bacterium]
MRNLLLLIMIVLNVCASTSSPILWDDQRMITDDVEQALLLNNDSFVLIEKSEFERWDLSKRITRKRLKIKMRLRSKLRLRWIQRLRWSQRSVRRSRIRDAVEMSKKQEEERFFQEEKPALLPDYLCPEPEVAQCIRRFLDRGKFAKDMGKKNDRLHSWLSEAFAAEKQWENELITYPFSIDLMRESVNLEDEFVWSAHQYTREILEVMSRLHGIFCWEYQQSSLSPKCVGAIKRWKEEDKYPNAKKILRAWKKGPFPDSFCGNIMFFMQNRARLESFGCDMKFLDDCRHHLPALLDHVWQDSTKYRAFYRDVLWLKPDYYKKQTSDLAQITCSKEYIEYYKYPLRCLQHFCRGLKDVKRGAQYDAAMWFCGLAKNLMIADILLGKRPALTFSIQGIAAYINDRLEYVQFHPNYYGLNTDTLNALVLFATGNGRDVQLIGGELQECGAVHSLNKKRHGLKWGLLHSVLRQNWFPLYYGKGTESFGRTKIAIGALTKFGVSGVVVEGLQSTMDEVGVIPSYLYHNPLTEYALNAFLRKFGKEGVVCAPELNDAQRTVECILRDNFALIEHRPLQFFCARQSLQSEDCLLFHLT